MPCLSARGEPEALAARYCQKETAGFRENMDATMSATAKLFRETLGANYVATILMGGYGRGWGAMLQTADGVVPVNDLDIAVVTQQRLPPEMLLVLHEKATAIVNPDSRYDMRECSVMDVHADVMNFVSADFARLQPSQFHMDLVHGSRVVDGPDVLAGAVSVQASDLDPGDALRLIFNHVINLFEPMAVARVGEKEALAPAFFTATKAAIASGAAITILEKRYSSDPAERIESLQALLKVEPANQVIRHCPEFADVVQEFTLARCCADETKIAAAPEYFRRARGVILTAARYAVTRTFQRPWSEDISELARTLPALWVTENVTADSGQGFRPRQVARRLLQTAGLKPRPAPWKPRALIFAAGLPILASLSYETGAWRLDEDALGVGIKLLKAAEVDIPHSTPGKPLWQSAARAAVGALKRQNWIR